MTSDRRRLAILGQDGSVALWDQEKRERRILPAGLVPSGSRFGGVLLFSPGEQNLLVAWNDQTGLSSVVVIFDVESGRMRRIPVSFMVTACSVSQRDDLLAIAGPFVDTDIEIIDLKTAKTVSVLSGHRAWISNLRFLGDGRKLLSVSADQSIRIWDVAAARQIGQFNGHRSEIHSLALSADEKHLFTGGKNGAVLEFDLSVASAGTTANIGVSNILSLAFSPDGQQAVLLLRDGTLHLWDVASRRDIRQLDPVYKHAATDFGFPMIQLVQYSPDARTIYYPRNDGAVRAINLATDQAKTILPPNASIVRLLLCVRETGHLIAARDDGWITEMDANGLVLNQWLAPEAFRNLRLNSAAVSPKGIWLVLGNEAGQLRRSRLDNSDVLTVRGHGDSVPDLAFLDELRFVSVSTSGEAIVRNVSNLEASPALRGHLLGLHSVAATADRKRIITGSGEGAVKIWDWEAGEEVGALRGKGLVGSVTASIDGNVIATTHNGVDFGGDNGILRIWCAPSWAEIQAEEIRMKGATEQP
jgi:WD40 repeat protein